MKAATHASASAAARKRRLGEAMEILKSLDFGPRQSNEVAAYLEGLGVVIAPSAKMPDVVVHDAKRNWLLLVEAVTSAGAVDWKRRKELKELFKGCRAGPVFVTAFESRRAMQSFLPQISWETEVWVAEAPDHLIHFDGERFLGPYPD